MKFNALFCIPFLKPVYYSPCCELHLLGFGPLLESGKNEKPFSIWGGGFFCIHFAPDMALKELWIKLLDYAYFVHRYV